MKQGETETTDNPVAGGSRFVPSDEEWAALKADVEALKKNSGAAAQKQEMDDQTTPSAVIARLWTTPTNWCVTSLERQLSCSGACVVTKTGCACAGTKLRSIS